MAVSSAAVFNICPVITNHSYVRASSSALKLVEGYLELQNLEERSTGPRLNASSSKSDCCVLKRVFKLYSYCLGVTNF